MTTCVSSYVQPGRTQPHSSKLKTYSPAAAIGTVQTALWQVTPLASAKNFCTSADCKDQIKIRFEHECTPGFVTPDVILYNYTGATDATLACEIANAVNQSLTANASGYWGVDGTKVTYRGIHPGTNVKLTFEYDRSHFTIEQLANVPATKGSSQKLMHGTVAHTPALTVDSCGNDSSSGDRPIAIAPDTASHYAGIVVETYHSASYSTSAFDACNDCCAPVDTCVEIACGCCTEVDILFEGEMPAVIPSKLYYRVAPAGTNTKLGLFAAAAGDGLIEFPAQFNAVRRNGQYLVINVH